MEITAYLHKDTGISCKEKILKENFQNVYLSIFIITKKNKSPKLFSSSNLINWWSNRKETRPRRPRIQMQDVHVLLYCSSFAFPLLLHCFFIAYSLLLQLFFSLLHCFSLAHSLLLHISFFTPKEILNCSSIATLLLQ